MLGIFVKHSIVVGIVLIIAWISQWGFFGMAPKSVYAPGVKSENNYVAKADAWLKTNVYPKLTGVSGEVAGAQDFVQEKIMEEKNNLVENSTTAVKKAVAEKLLQFLGVSPQDLGSCPATGATN